MPRWSFDQIKQGLEKFKIDNGRLPSALEIDKLDYLPSSRQIQRKYGGLMSLRQNLGYSADDFDRSTMARESGLIGINGEKAVEKMLIKHFGDICVHREKPWGDGKNRLDFYVYSPNGNFGVEVISSKHKNSLVSNLNIKFPKYETFGGKIYLIVIQTTLSLDEIDIIISRKKIPQPLNMQIVTFSGFEDIIKKLPKYKLTL